MGWRDIPHPTYGHYGGASKKCDKGCHTPIDWMDAAFKQHDQNLKDNKITRMTIDTMLVDALLKGKAKKLARPIYGRLYRVACITIFTAVHIWK